MKMIELRELGSFRNGLNFAKSEARGKGCKILGVGDFGSATFIHAASLEEINENLVSEEDLISDDDIVFVRSNGNKALVGRMLFAQEIKEKVCYSGFCIRFRPNREVIDPVYLYYMLKTPYCKQQYTPSQQTNINNLSQDTLGTVIIPIPDTIEEQKKRSELLKNLDGKIEINTQVCQKLESMAKTLYDYWFVQFDFPDENGKPYRTNGGRMTWCEEMKKHIPEEWKVERISELLEKIPKSLRIKTEGYHKDGSIAIIDQSERYIAGYTNDYSAKIYKEDGYIIFGDHTRVVKYIRFPFARGADGTQVLSSNDERMPNELFYQAIKSIDLSNQGYARHYKFLIENVIILPDRVVARHYKETVVPLYEKYRQKMFENIELQRLRDWLLPMLMNGQATITYTDNERTSI